MDIEQIIERNMGLVGSVVNKFNPLPGDKEELLQIGRIGLWKAILAFDETRGYKLSTLAWYYIRSEIQRHLSQQKKYVGGSAIHNGLDDTTYSINISNISEYIPTNLTSREQTIIEMKLCKNMTFQEIADKLGNFSKSQVIKIYKRGIRKIQHANK